jgi:hypothetical protein
MLPSSTFFKRMNESRASAQTVSRRLPTPTARVRVQVREDVGFVVDKVAPGLLQ